MCVYIDRYRYITYIDMSLQRKNYIVTRTQQQQIRIKIPLPGS